MADQAGPMDPELQEALHGEMVPKFLGTLDAAGKPNVVPIITLDAADPRTLIFGELFVQKTRSNLQVAPQVGALVATEDLRVWTLRARFGGFVEGGPHLEQMNKKNLFRYNAYLGIRRAGVFDCQAISGRYRFSKLQVAAELLPVKAWARFAGGRGSAALPPRVAEKYARAQSLKILAFAGPDGFPELLPLFSLQPTRSDILIFGTRLLRPQLARLPVGARVAVAVITMDAIAYQVKGVYQGLGRTPAGKLGRIRVDEVYSASPPLLGDRIQMVKRGT